MLPPSHRQQLSPAIIRVTRLVQDTTIKRENLIAPDYQRFGRLLADLQGLEFGQGVGNFTRSSFPSG